MFSTNIRRGRLLMIYTDSSHSITPPLVTGYSPRGPDWEQALAYFSPMVYPNLAYATRIMNNLVIAFFEGKI
jgi:hypothetical protein